MSDQQPRTAEEQKALHKILHAIHPLPPFNKGYVLGVAAERLGLTHEDILRSGDLTDPKTNQDYLS